MTKRLRQRKHENVVNKEATIVNTTGRRSTPSTKTAAGPLKSWSKVEVKNKKRKNMSKSESDYDVEEDVQDITLGRKSAAKKRSTTATSASLEIVKFYPTDNAVKWEFVNQRRIRLERNINNDVSKFKEVVELIEKAGLIKTVTKICPCYEKLVKEFVVNIPTDLDNPHSKWFGKVFVRSHEVTFLPSVINEFLGRSLQPQAELEDTDNQICREITGGQEKSWPVKGKLSAGKLSVKYVILHIIGTATNHTSIISVVLGRVIYAIGK